MDAESFTALALRVLAREATEDERRALETELAADPSRREEFEQLKITHDVLRIAAPMTAAAQATEPELPAWRVNELRTAVRGHFGPETNRSKTASHPILRWLLAGGGATALALVVVFLCLADRSIEVGVYRTDQVRGTSMSLSPESVPAAHIVAFDEDATFDQWQHTLTWYQHGKVWVDNENNLIHILRRDTQGHLVEHTEPLASTDREQQDQITQATASLQKR